MTDNPYSSDLGNAAGHGVSKKDALTTVSVSDETLETLQFTGTLVRCVSVCFGLGAFGYLFSTLMGFYYLGGVANWDWLHTIQAYRLLFFPAMVLLAFFGWRFSNAIRQLAKKQSTSLNAFLNTQAYFWLAVALYVFVIICGIGLTFSASYAYSP